MLEVFAVQRFTHKLGTCIRRSLSTVPKQLFTLQEDQFSLGFIVKRNLSAFYDVCQSTKITKNFCSEPIAWFTKAF